jgi:hypothetical protein
VGNWTKLTWHHFGNQLVQTRKLVPLVVVSSAEAAHEFLKVQDKVWSSRPPSIATKLISYNYKGIVSTPYGAHWRHMRKICRLELLSIKRIESFRESRAKEFSQMVRSIMADSDQGKVVELDVKLGHLQPIWLLTCCLVRGRIVTFLSIQAITLKKQKWCMKCKFENDNLLVVLSAMQVF